MPLIHHSDAAQISDLLAVLLHSQPRTTARVRLALSVNDDIFDIVVDTDRCGGMAAMIGGHPASQEDLSAVLRLALRDEDGGLCIVGVVCNGVLRSRAWLMHGDLGLSGLAGGWSPPAPLASIPWLAASVCAEVEPVCFSWSDLAESRRRVQRFIDSATMLAGRTAPWLTGRRDAA